MKFSLYIARRYLFSKSSRNVVNIISFISCVAVFVGALALFIVMAGFSGLKEFGLSFSNAYDPDLKVSPASGKIFQFSSEEKEKLSQIGGIAAFSEVIEERVLLSFKSKNMPAYLKGVAKNHIEVVRTDSAIILGSWLTDLESQVVIGFDVSDRLSLGVSDYSSPLQIMVPKPGKGQISSLTGAFYRANAFVSGIYSINEEMDGKYVISHIDFARDLLKIEAPNISFLDIKLSSGADESKVRKQIHEILAEEVIIKNRIQQNESLYKMLNTENLAVYLICTLVLIIALFNMIGSIIMVILDKRENVKTLFNMGASLRQIKRIFFLQGVLMTFLGGSLGTLVGAIIVLLQLKFELVMITPNMPYPIALTGLNFLIVFGTIMLLGVGASYIGSNRVKKVLGD